MMIWRCCGGCGCRWCASRQRRVCRHGRVRYLRGQRCGHCLRDGAGSNRCCRRLIGRCCGSGRSCRPRRCGRRPRRRRESRRCGCVGRQGCYLGRQYAEACEHRVQQHLCGSGLLRGTAHADERAAPLILNRHRGHMHDRPVPIGIHGDFLGQTRHAVCIDQSRCCSRMSGQAGPIVLQDLCGGKRLNTLLGHVHKKRDLSVLTTELDAIRLLLDGPSLGRIQTVATLLVRIWRQHDVRSALLCFRS